jgi:cytochrome oxidase Cu insertion factor (SCO1/SenC/PrrC family)
LKPRGSSIEPYLIGVVFLMPLLLAALVYLGPWRASWLEPLPSADREVIEPPITVPLGPLTGPSGEPGEDTWLRYRWSLIYARMSPCENQCLRQLSRLRLLRLALGPDRDRVQRVFLYAGSVPSVVRQDPALLMGRLDDARGASLLQRLGVERLAAGRIYIADPRGNIVVAYPGEAEQAGLLEDLKRLLRISQIG